MPLLSLFEEFLQFCAFLQQSVQASTGLPQHSPSFLHSSQFRLAAATCFVSFSSPAIHMQQHVSPSLQGFFRNATDFEISFSAFRQVVIRSETQSRGEGGSPVAVCGRQVDALSQIRLVPLFRVDRETARVHVYGGR